MTEKIYLLDTHALIFWSTGECVTKEFLSHLDNQEKKGNVYISSISFWEVALLSKKGKIEISDIHRWKTDLLSNTGIRLVDPTASEMIDSTLLPDYHKDPFDRLLIAQALSHQAQFVTKDSLIKKYSVPIFWI